MFTGLKSVIYPSNDLAKDKEFWTNVSGTEPYFDEPYYVGFNINGAELGLDPNASQERLTYPVSYWHVENAKKAAEKLISSGIKVHSGLKDVGGGMMMGTFEDASGNIFGIIDQQNG